MVPHGSAVLCGFFLRERPAFAGKNHKFSETAAVISRIALYTVAVPDKIKGKYQRD